MIAHIRQTDGTEQSVREHSLHTAALAARALKPCGLHALGYLTGLLHDAGKCTAGFERYLRAIYAAGGQVDETVEKAAPHAPVGAIWVYERYFGGDPVRKCAAQIAAMAILGHHAGLTDCLAQDDRQCSPFLEAMCRDKRALHYDEAVEHYLREVADEAELDALFEQACEELRAFRQRMPAGIRAFCAAMTARLLLGAVADADCWDAACFERGEDALTLPPDPPWQAWLDRLDARIAAFPTTEQLSAVRAGISRDCRDAGLRHGAGVYRLTVPTGGGKTLSGLLFALTQAARSRASTERILYIAPFNTILDQNAKVIRASLREDAELLEHHGDVVFDDSESEAEQRHRVLTERWTSRIILTSTVQLMNTLFKSANRNARRLPRLVNAILIFDEIQALPRKCTVLFECAARFLADCMGCTVLLCTATQPTLRQHKTDMPMTADALDECQALGEELLPGTARLFEQLRRVRFIDERSKPRTHAMAAQDAAATLRQGKSLLIVVNTKRAAREIYGEIKRADLPADAVCVHLTTDMCAAHRKRVIDALIAALDRRKHDPDAPVVCCVSTSLIEAGVDISFPVVIRSMTGLPSILQAAGRCNRNRETDCGEVYIWRLTEESLSSGLAEVRQAQQDTDGILDSAAQTGTPIDRPEMIDRYYDRMLHNDAKRASRLFYPIDTPLGERYLASLLGGNRRMRDALAYRADDPTSRLALYCCWRTVGDSFQVIDEDVVAVVAPYEEGRQLIDQLGGRHSMQAERALLKKAQQYCVSMYRSAFNRLRELHAVYPIGETGAWALKDEYYDPETGVLRAEQSMPDLYY